MAEKFAKKWIGIIDIKKCTNCRNCQMAIKDEYIGNDYPGHSTSMPSGGENWFQVHQKERGQTPMVEVSYMPYTCMNCRSAPCINAAKEEAVYMREDGIVMIDPKKSRGQKELVEACPYHVIFWNQERNVPQKWNFDTHLLDAGWEKPRCVEVCPTNALQMIKIQEDKIDGYIKKHGLQVVNPGLRTRPMVFYKNLSLYTHEFIGGSILLEMAPGQFDCHKGVIINLYQNKRKIASTITNEFGDFKIEGMEGKSGEYILQAQHEGFQSRAFKVDFIDSYYMGVIELYKANEEQDDIPLMPDDAGFSIE